MSKSVLAILAHPDDAEILCAGTLIRLRQEHNWTVHIATMTAGDCGTAEYPPEKIAEIRRSEGASAAKLIGGEYHCLGARDMRVEYSNDLVEKTVQLMCKVRASVVLTHSPDDYHPDHEATSKIVRTATFAAPIPNYLHGRWIDPPLEHIPHLYYCDPVEGKDILGRPIVPGFWIEVTKVMDLKSQMLAAHASQRNWLIKHHGVDDYIISMKDWSAKQGKNVAFEYAEGFRQHLGHSYPQNNLLAELLGSKTL
ncbi:PIG-L family deacetylase [Telmatocola sphagniphila]|uniref:PIG-L family deacetylase n=1 Tax=Telmatocola sphagniphila TaxID=1123043 RepID=A0A8E6B6F5_9BACT|nr:PIG-L deacetylase family protein [Telmatocola sphagniphila]QVL32743.1 PIG-L family deacetylase [Telmatocola sphagniphila]